jgi:hypothetical protein
MEPIHAMYAKWMERLASDSPDMTRARLVCTAMDGLYFQRLMGLRLCEGETCGHLMNHALDLLTPKEGEPS